MLRFSIVDQHKQHVANRLPKESRQRERTPSAGSKSNSHLETVVVVVVGGGVFWIFWDEKMMIG